MRRTACGRFLGQTAVFSTIAAYAVTLAAAASGVATPSWLSDRSSLATEALIDVDIVASDELSTAHVTDVNGTTILLPASHLRSLCLGDATLGAAVRLSCKAGLGGPMGFTFITCYLVLVIAYIIHTMMRRDGYCVRNMRPGRPHGMPLLRLQFSPDNTVSQHNCCCPAEGVVPQKQKKQGCSRFCCSRRQDLFERSITPDINLNLRFILVPALFSCVWPIHELVKATAVTYQAEGVPGVYCTVHFKRALIFQLLVANLILVVKVIFLFTHWRNSVQFNRLSLLSHGWLEDYVAFDLDIPQTPEGIQQAEDTTSEFRAHVTEETEVVVMQMTHVCLALLCFDSDGESVRDTLSRVLGLSSLFGIVMALAVTAPAYTMCIVIVFSEDVDYWALIGVIECWTFVFVPVTINAAVKLMPRSRNGTADIKAAVARQTIFVLCCMTFLFVGVVIRKYRN
jgi:hypothetical protein